MADQLAAPESEEARGSETYPIGYESKTVEFLARRTAARHAAFFIPYLGSGLSLLDGGCGPGTITAGLAHLVAPGEVVGIDVEPSQIAAARANVAARGLTNARFEVGDIYTLRYPAHSFDRVFLHGVLEHLSEPVRALREVHRVLKPGGVLGVRNGAVSANLIDPGGSGLRALLDQYSRLSRGNGGDPEFGRSQIGALGQAGFARIRASASYDLWTETPEVAAGTAKAMAAMLREGSLGSQLVERGMVDRVWLEKTASAIEKWASDSAAFAAEAWCEAVAWKD